MPFEQVIAAQGRIARRPAAVEELLLYPLTANPIPAEARCDRDWAKEHAISLRFRVGGLNWFVGRTKLTTDQLVFYKKLATEAASDAGWPDMSGASELVKRSTRAHWGAIARPQYIDMSLGRAALFAKAALYLLTCEVALQDLIDRKRLPAGVADVAKGEDVYQHMAIVPACWHLARFNDDYVAQQKKIDARFSENLAAFVDHTDLEIVKELTSGKTMTFDIVERVRQFCADPARGFDPVGNVRVSCAGGVLGTGHASAVERVDV